MMEQIATLSAIEAAKQDNSFIDDRLCVCLCACPYNN